MNTTRKALEIALEAIESLSLIDLERNPQLGQAIPFLRDALMQEEECIHTWDKDRVCIACKESEPKPSKKVDTDPNNKYNRHSIFTSGEF